MLESFNMPDWQRYSSDPSNQSLAASHNSYIKAHILILDKATHCTWKLKARRSIRVNVNQYHLLTGCSGSGASWCFIMIYLRNQASLWIWSTQDPSWQKGPEQSSAVLGSQSLHGSNAAICVSGLLRLSCLPWKMLSCFKAWEHGTSWMSMMSMPYRMWDTVWSANVPQQSPTHFFGIKYMVERTWPKHAEAAFKPAVPTWYGTLIHLIWFTSPHMFYSYDRCWFHPDW